MPHGTPDWGVTAGAKTVFQLTDLAEHAVRLGSVDYFHRAGDVFFIDDFAAGLTGWGTLTLGTSSATDLTRVWTRSGLLAARLVAGPEAGGYAQIDRRLAYPTLSRLGFELAFYFSDSIDRLSLAAEVFDGTNLRSFGVRYDDVNSRLQYFDSGGGWTTFATGVDLLRVNGPFHIMKLIVDAATSEYTRFVLNDTVYTLANIAANSSASATSPYLRVSITAYNRDGVLSTTYIDDVIFTQNEPS